ncbi:MAG: Cytochrome c oxidase subunit 3, partial [Cyanobacteriota bacterium]
MTNATESLNTTSPAETSHAHAHPDFRVWGLLVFLISESLMFGGLFAAYLVLRGGA